MIDNLNQCSEITWEYPSKERNCGKWLQSTGVYPFYIKTGRLGY